VYASHLRTQGHWSEGIEPVVRCPEGEGGPSDFLKEWTTLHDGNLAPFDEEITIKIEGRRRERGEQIVTNTEASKRERKVLRLRYAEFDPLERQPSIPPDLMASEKTRIFVIQLKLTPDQLALKVLSPDGAIYHGNHGLESGNWSKPGGTRDSANNVENVFVSRPTEGIWTVQVSAARIALDQHAETPEFDNDFALVVVGVAPNDSRPEQPVRK
jgi:hypothetical protein